MIFIGIIASIVYVVVAGFVVLIIQNFVDLISGIKQPDWLVPDPNDKLRATINLTALSLGLIIISFFIKVIGRIILLKQTLLAANLLKNQLYYKINLISLEQFYQYQRSTLINRLNVDYFKLEKAAINVLVYMIENIFEVFVYIGFSIALSGYLSLIYLFFIPLVIFLIIHGSKKTKDHYKKSYQSLDNLYQVIRENIIGVKVVRTFNLEDFQSLRYDNHHKQWLKSVLRADLILAMMWKLIFLAINIFITLTLVTAGYLNKTNSSLTPGVVIAFLNYLTYTSYVVIGICDYVLNILKTRSAKQRIKEILDLKEEVELNTAIFDEIVGKISINGLDFKYEQNNFNVLNKINLTIKPKDNIGIIGSIGSGKSTLCKLIAKINNAPDNMIMIDNVDINKYQTRHIRQSVAIDFQKKQLFSGTIKLNILKANSDADQDRINQVLDHSCANEFINNLDDKLEHNLIEFANNLSGGQKARICIARTLIRDSKIMIFDDSLSALDNITAKKVLDKILANYQNRTKIFVSQQIRTIKDLDKIIVLDQGNVVGYDTHKNLLTSCEVYKQIYDSQKRIGDEV
ncbi:ABC transporter ATP-binding protein [Mycoplasmoides gallisepticum]|nr:ABC transporter ATP-binding protein [Mycoplasmoides gallisepticum]